MTTPSGARFEGPKGWFVTTKGESIVLDDPERDLSLTLIEVKEPDAQKAIDAAWKQTQPGFARTPKQTMNIPATEGWDSITQIPYEVGGNENRTVVALAQRKGNVHYVMLIDGTNAGFDRRYAQFKTIVSTFRAPGVEEESFAGKKPNVLDAPRLKELEAFVTDALAKTRVPGAAVAVVQNGKVVFEKGFGTRTAGKKEPVTPNTLFMIGSTTKSLTSLMMARLVDQGKFGWDTPVTSLLPSFVLGDEATSKQLQMKHTVCACTGLPRQDMEMLFEYAGVSPEDRVAVMKTMKPTTAFGETFQYSNTLVAAGGYVAAHAIDQKNKLGPAYDQAMQSVVFDPLGMKSTTFDFGIAKSREHASPHGEDLDRNFVPVPLSDEEFVVSVRPAGAAWSNLHDMERVVAMELAKGKDDKGHTFVSEKNLLERRTPQVKITDKATYGLAMFVESKYGVNVMGHGGNTHGFTSDMLFLPDHDVGVVLLTNGDGSANYIREALKRRLLEILFDGKPEASQKLSFRLEQEAAAVAKERAKIDAPDQAWLTDLVGTYKNASLGTVKVRMDGKKALFDAGEWKSAVARKREDDGTVKLVLVDPPFVGMEFSTTSPNGKKTLTLDASQQTYVFERAP